MIMIDHHFFQLKLYIRPKPFEEKPKARGQSQGPSHRIVATAQ